MVGSEQVGPCRQWADGFRSCGPKWAKPPRAVFAWANGERLKTKQPGADLHRVASIRWSAPPRARTEDPLIKSQLLPRRKHNTHKVVTANADSGRTTGRTRPENEGKVEAGTPDPDLAALVAAWPTLPDPIRAAIRALVATAGRRRHD